MLLDGNLIYIHKNTPGITTSGVPSGWAEPEEYISSAYVQPIGITT